MPEEPVLVTTESVTNPQPPVLSVSQIKNDKRPSYCYKVDSKKGLVIPGVGDTLTIEDLDEIRSLGTKIIFS